MKRGIVGLIIFTFTLAGISGCASIQNDSTRTKTEGTLVGAGAGATAGAVIGAIVGGSKGAAIGAAIGAGVGAAGGFAYGTHVANEKEKYAKMEDWLDACIASLEETNKETMAYNSQLAKDINDLDSETAQLAADYKSKKTDKTAMLAEKEKIDVQLAEAKEKVKKAKWELKNQEEVLAQSKTEPGQEDFSKAMDAEIKALKKHIAELEEHTSELASLSSRMAV